jgi:hypothetical protein
MKFKLTQPWWGSALIVAFPGLVGLHPENKDGGTALKL